MKKLTLIAALLASTLGVMGSAQAGGQNQVTLQAVPANANIVVVDARHPQRVYNNHREQMARAAHHQRKAQNTVKIIVVKQAAQAKKKVVVKKKPVVVVKKVVYVKPAPVRHHQRPGTVVDRVVYQTATTTAAPVRYHHHPVNQVSLQAVIK
jgi:hypothetical protein